MSRVPGSRIRQPPLITTRPFNIQKQKFTRFPVFTASIEPGTLGYSAGGTFCLPIERLHIEQAGDPLQITRRHRNIEWIYLVCRVRMKIEGEI
jgi:hypothetical protein